jgi:SARP family transcriptional regulator, regulator of embCAB operon
MRFEILGNLRIRDDQRIFAVNARKMEAVLATLLVRADEMVSTAQLSYELWGEDPPKRYLAAIHVYVSQLRKLLTTEDGKCSPIVTRAPGYVLLLGEHQLDALEFKRLVHQGRQAARARRLDEAADASESALDLWHGPAVGELRAGPIVENFTTWAEESRLECLGMLVEAGLRLGRHRELIGRLSSLAAEHPLHEGFYRQLMIALYRSERQADALQVYRSARRTLNQELGIEPGRALQDVHQAILLARRDCELLVAA